MMNINCVFLILAIATLCLASNGLGNEVEDFDSDVSELTSRISAKTYVYDEEMKTCLPEKEYGDICIAHVQCTHPNQVCSQGKCMCTDNAVHVESLRQCLSKKKYYEDCESSSQCTDTMQCCEGGKCKCEPTAVYDTTFKKCVTKKVYGEDCAMNSQCTGIYQECSGTLKKCMCSGNKTYDVAMKICTEDPIGKLEEEMKKMKEELKAEMQSIKTMLTNCIVVPSGYQKMTRVEGYLKALIGKKDSEVARADCQDDDPWGRTDLVVINSQEKNDDVQDFLKKESLDQGWIGLKQKNGERYIYEWVNGGTLSTADGNLYNDGTNGEGYKNFEDDEDMDWGSNPHDTQDCITLHSYNGKWIDWTCENGIHVCEFIP